MNFKLIYRDFVEGVPPGTYVTLEVATKFKFKACEWLSEMKVGEVRLDDSGDSWERVE